MENGIERAIQLTNRTCCSRSRRENRRHESSFPQLRGIKILLLFSHASLHSVHERRRIYVYANTLPLRVRILRRYVIFFLLLFYYHKFKFKKKKENRNTRLELSYATETRNFFFLIELSHPKEKKFIK